MVKTRKRATEANGKGTIQLKKYNYIYYYDDSGDNVKGIVEAMRSVDVKSAPKFVIASVKKV